jgi:hypothetical protein
MIFIGDSKESVVDSWVGGIVGNGDSGSDARTSTLVHNDNRGGLGFKASSSHPSKSDFSDSQAKLKRKQRSENTQSIKEKHKDLHGVVEDIEESRTSIAKAPRNAATEMEAKVKSKTKTSESQTIVAKSEGNPQHIQVKSEASNAFSETLTEKRKRPKTRSKQKNIRRDNRENDKKPAHLLIGSKDYQGRPLTSVCNDSSID